jgi:SpoVK/Ycf46/Vps4 family AAA+-type ATPase
MMIKALIENRARYNPGLQAPAWTADYIRNKGDGLIMLFHGPPGAGKTFVSNTSVSLFKSYN